jgi:hypothetical protein
VQVINKWGWGWGWVGGAGEVCVGGGLEAVGHLSPHTTYTPLSNQRPSNLFSTRTWTYYWDDEFDREAGVLADIIFKVGLFG